MLLDKDEMITNKGLFLRWSKMVYEYGKDGFSFKGIEEEINKMFENINTRYTSNKTK